MNGDIPNNCSNAEKKPKPKLVLSVIGDSKSFVPRAWPKSVFKRALIEAGKSSGGGLFVNLLSPPPHPPPPKKNSIHFF